MSFLHLPAFHASIRWTAFGEGDPILYLPGLSMPILPGFAAIAADKALSHRRHILLDYLGSGESDHPTGFDYSPASHAETILRVLDHVGVNAVDVVGHSMGGTVGIFLAELAPNRVRTLLVCEGNVDPGGGMMSSRVSQPGKAAFLKGGYDTLLSDLRKKAIGGSEGADRLVAGWQKADPLGLYANAKALVDLPDDMFARFAALPMPKLFVYGANSLGDTPTPDTPDQSRLAAHGITPLVVPDAGHAMMLDNPTGFVDALTTALKHP